MTSREAAQATYSDTNEHWGRLPALVVVTGIQGTGKSSVAAAIGRALGAPVLGHDWVMSGLRPYDPVEKSLDEMGPGARRAVGWSLLCALARSQLRQGRSVILDGVTGEKELANCRVVALDENAPMVLVLTRCSDPALLRSRIEQRQRSIPNWYELTWADVKRTRATWKEPMDVDLVLETSTTWDEIEARLSERLVQIWDDPDER